MTKEYLEYIQSPQWKLIAEKVKELAGYRCQVCNRDTELEAHHRTYRNLFHELENLGDLTCLCRTCHGLFHRVKQAASPRPQRTPRAKPQKDRKFFRKAAQRLSINQYALAEKGKPEVIRMLEERKAQKSQRKHERNLRRMARWQAAGLNVKDFYQP